MNNSIVVRPAHARGHAICISALLCSAIAGCASPPQGHEAVQTFAAASSEASGAVVNAFMQVNDASYAAQSARFLRDYDTRPAMPDFTRFVSQASIDKRAQVFEVLAQYSAGLLDLTGEEPQAHMDTATRKLGESLTLLTVEGSSQLASTDASAALQAGLNALGRSLIERRRSAAISEAATSADPHVQRICSALLDDMALLGAALRQQNATMAQDQYQYLRTSMDAPRAPSGQAPMAPLNLIQKRDEILRVADLGRRGMYSEDFLHQLTPMIKAMAKAHTALTEKYQNGASRSEAARHFLNEVRRVKALHTSLRQPAKES